jgi:hypothetical protein
VSVTDVSIGLRALSATVFGQHYRLELMTFIAGLDDGIFCLKDASDALDVGNSCLQRPLSDLRDAGLVSDLHSGDSRRRYYQRNPSLAWDFALELASQAE